MWGFRIWGNKNRGRVSAPPPIEFESQIAKQALDSKRIAWYVAAAGFTFALGELIAIVVMLPLKQVVPYLIYVDKNTGVTQVVDVATPARITSDELNARHWAERYVLARERYIYQILQEDFDFVIATSSDVQQKEYRHLFDPGPQKKDVLFRDQIEERIRITNVQVAPGQTGRATVRYIKETYRTGSRDPDKIEGFICDLAFYWSGTGKWSDKSILTNPFGFKVTAYRTTPEITHQ